MLIPFWPMFCPRLSYIAVDWYILSMMLTFCKKNIWFLWFLICYFWILFYIQFWRIPSLNILMEFGKKRKSQKIGREQKKINSFRMTSIKKDLEKNVITKKAWSTIKLVFIIFILGANNARVLAIANILSPVGCKIC